MSFRLSLSDSLQTVPRKQGGAACDYSKGEGHGKKDFCFGYGVPLVHRGIAGTFQHSSVNCDGLRFIVGVGPGRGLAGGAQASYWLVNTDC